MSKKMNDDMLNNLTNKLVVFYQNRLYNDSKINIRDILSFKENDLFACNYHAGFDGIVCVFDKEQNVQRVEHRICINLMTYDNNYITLVANQDGFIRCGGILEIINYLPEYRDQLEDIDTIEDLAKFAMLNIQEKIDFNNLYRVIDNNNQAKIRRNNVINYISSKILSSNDVNSEKLVRLFYDDINNNYIHDFKINTKKLVK